MTRHIFKLVWNRKRSTGLISVEILICFLVLCGVLSATLNLLNLKNQPLGFTWENVWKVQVDGPRFYRVPDEELARNLEGMKKVLDEAGNLPEVVQVALSANIPYDNSSWMNTIWIDGVRVNVLDGPVSPEVLDLLDLELVYGRWLEEGDLALAYTPLVITRNFARDLFDNEDAVGQVVPQFGENGEIEEPEEESQIRRVVGVVEDFKRGGEFTSRPYASFYIADTMEGHFLPHQFMIRVQPGTETEFEEKLMRALQGVAPQWSFEMTSMEDMRHRTMMAAIGPLIIAGVVAGFLIIMVGLGLVGVLWQSVTRRTAELGLRRALGASALSVRRQVLGELWALTTLSVLVGSVLFLQLPLIGVNFGFSWSVFLGGLTLAAIVIYSLVTVCGLYPTWLATRVHPAEALQYE